MQPTQTHTTTTKPHNQSMKGRFQKTVPARGVTGVPHGGQSDQHAPNSTSRIVGQQHSHPAASERKARSKEERFRSPNLPKENHQSHPQKELRSMMVSLTVSLNRKRTWVYFWRKELPCLFFLPRWFISTWRCSNFFSQRFSVPSEWIDMWLVPKNCLCWFNISLFFLYYGYSLLCLTLFWIWVLGGGGVGFKSVNDARHQKRKETKGKKKKTKKERKK